MFKALKSRLSPRAFGAVKLAFGLAIGAGAGYAYYALVGCESGGCPITSSPVISSLWGAAIGGVTAAG